MKSAEKMWLSTLEEKQTQLDLAEIETWINHASMNGRCSCEVHFQHNPQAAMLRMKQLGYIVSVISAPKSTVDVLNYKFSVAWMPPGLIETK